jgi:ribosomal protein L34E
MELTKTKPFQFPNPPYEYSKLAPSERAILRKEYEIRQKGLCQFCKEPLNCVPSAQVRKAKLNLNLFPAGFLRNPVHLHHCHDTDLTIGAVHAECNAYLWQYLGE